jgi:hypothetical protein
VAKLNGRCVVGQRHDLYAYIRSRLRLHIGSLADIGYVVQESPATYGGLKPGPHHQIQDIQPAIGVRGARLSAKVTQVAPVLPSLVEQPLRPVAVVQPVSLTQVSWQLAFWWAEAAVQRA